jgi:signal transduction histidine kinase
MNQRVKNQSLKFAMLPSFAAFLMKSHLEDLNRELVRIAIDLKVPFLKYFENLSEEQMLAVSRPPLLEFLTHLSKNRASEYIRLMLDRWQTDQLPGVGKGDIIANDISLMNHIRKKSFLKFIPLYTSDVTTAIALVDEIELYARELEQSSFELYKQIQEKHINENQHFIEKVNGTIPAITYVYDVAEQKLVYTNEKTANSEELGRAPDASLIHPDDLAIIIASRKKIGEAGEGKIIQTEYRIRQHSGDFHWQRNYESVFRKDENGAVSQTIGIAFYIEREKQIERQLQHRESQLLEAQELAAMGSFDWDIVTGKTEITPQLKKILGLNGSYTLKQLLSRVHAADRNRLQTAIALAMEQTGYYNCEFRYLHEDEGKEKMLWSNGIISFNNSVPINIRGSVMDVSERHALIQRLQQSDELYKQAQALAHVGNWSWNLISNKIAWSDELYRIFGMKPQLKEMTLEALQAYVHPDDRDLRWSKLTEAIETGGSYEMHYRIIRANNEVRTVHSKGEVLKDETGKSYLMHGSIQDVTEQKLIMHQLVENQVFIKKVADATPSIITSYNVISGKYSFVSLGLKKILGYEPTKFLKEGLALTMKIIHPDDIASVIEKNNAALVMANSKGAEATNDIILDFQYRIRNKKGEYRWMHTYATIFDRNSAGQVEQVLNISYDVTSRVEAEQKIHQQTLELKQSNASLEEYAHVASHDLKEPLRKISTFGDRLFTNHQSELNSEGRSYLQKIIDSSRRMQQLIDDLLSVSVISAEKTFVPYSLSQLIEEVLSLLEYKIEEKNAVIESDATQTLMMVPSQFRQLFQNLLSNSLKFVRSDTVPVITIRTSELKPFEVQSYNLKNAPAYLRIIITDNGIGFQKHFSEQIFAIFQRLHTRRLYEGTGIGLAICRKIVENHGGVIFASGEVNKGAVFTIVVPFEQVLSS